MFQVPNRLNKNLEMLFMILTLLAIDLIFLITKKQLIQKILTNIKIVSPIMNIVKV